MRDSVAQGRPDRSDRSGVRSSLRRPGTAPWLVATILMLAATGSALTAERRYGSPAALFWLVTVGATVCAVGAAVVVAAGFRSRSAEVALGGAGLWAASVLPLVHGLTAPGVLYDESSAVTVSAFIALPAALVSGLPTIAPTWPGSRRLARHWVGWTVTTMTIVTAFAAWLLIAPDAIPPPVPGHPTTVAVSGGCLVAFVALSWRQLTLYWVSQRRTMLMASAAYLLLGSTALVWWQTSTFTLGWWLVHVMDITAVLLACLGLLAARQRSISAHDLLSPILDRDPLAALEFGLAPVVHRFIADLETKDRVTRDHVVRTTEAALRVGQSLDVPFHRLRFLGLGALLHDVGKLHVPVALITKPGRLTDREMAVMQRHSAIGAEMLAGIEFLAPAAGFVRHHHERVDGMGYPDALVGRQIPLEARIISVCDAFDAMAHTRQYRTGMGTERAEAVLWEHAGSQWDPVVVDAAIPVLRTLFGAAPRLDDVGRTNGRPMVSVEHACVCADALPPPPEHESAAVFS